MSCIYRGEVIESELSKNAKGGTELQRDLLLKHVSKEQLKDVAIHLSRVRKIYDDVPNIFWAHDLPNDPESAFIRNPEQRKAFDKFVFVSDWQMQMYHMMSGVPYGSSVVLPNAINPVNPADLPLFKVGDHDRLEVKLIYHTTPHRGLDILVPVFEQLSNLFKFKYPDIKLTLDVYSSFKIYGWEDRDQPFKELFERCKNHPDINYHGTVSNEEVRKALLEADIFAYPSIWPETSCIAAIEALASGCLVVCPNYAALPETTAKFANVYQFHEDINEHAKIFMHTLAGSIESFILHREAWQRSVPMQCEYFDMHYRWDRRATDWVTLIDNVKRSYDRKKNFLTVNTGGVNLV